MPPPPLSPSHALMSLEACNLSFSRWCASGVNRLHFSSSVWTSEGGAPSCQIHSLGFGTRFHRFLHVWPSRKLSLRSAESERVAVVNQTTPATAQRKHNAQAETEIVVIWHIFKSYLPNDHWWVLVFWRKVLSGTKQTKAKEMKKPSEQLHQYMPNTSRTLRALVDDNAVAAARLNDCRAEISFCTRASKLPSSLLRCSQVKSFRPIFKWRTAEGFQRRCCSHLSTLSISRWSFLAPTLCDVFFPCHIQSTKGWNLVKCNCAT